MPPANHRSENITESVPDSNRSFKQTFSSLRSTNFMYLWLGMLAMMSGMHMQMVARGYLVYEITNSASILGLVSAASSVPILVLSLIGGEIADRMNRKKVMMLSQLLNSLTAILVSVAIFTNTVEWYHLLAASVFQGATWAFLMPARQALIPSLVGQSQLSNAIALNAAGMSATTLIAPTIAGILYSVLGSGFVYAVIGGLTIVASVLTSMVKVEEPETKAAKKAMTSNIGEGISYVMHNRLVLVLIVIGLATSLLAMPIRFLMPVLVVDIYRMGPESLGLLLSFMGIGSLAGTLYIAWVGKWHRGGTLILGTLASGIALILLAILPFYAAAVGIMLLLGLGDAARRALNTALIMEATDDEYRGRVMSIFMMNFGFMPLGILPIGIMADAVGGQASVGLLGILIVLFTVFIFATQKQLRGIQ